MRPLLESRVRILAAAMITCIPDGDDAPAQRAAWASYIESEVGSVVVAAERDAFAEGIARGSELFPASVDR